MLNKENEINSFYRVNNNTLNEIIQRSLGFTPNAVLKIIFFELNAVYYCFIHLIIVSLSKTNHLLFYSKLSVGITSRYKNLQKYYQVNHHW